MFFVYEPNRQQPSFTIYADTVSDVVAILAVMHRVTVGNFRAIARRVWVCENKMEILQVVH